MLRALSLPLRRFCSASLTDGEKRMADLLKSKIPGSKSVEVQDVSNGCGSMYSIYVEATDFKGLTPVAQHKLVTGILREEIKEMHGLSIKTKVAK